MSNNCSEKNQSEVLSHTVSSDLLSSCSSLSLCARTHMNPYIIAILGTITRKSGLSFVSRECLCLFKVVLAGHVMDNSRAR